MSLWRVWRVDGPVCGVLQPHGCRRGTRRGKELCVEEACHAWRLVKINNTSAGGRYRLWVGRHWAQRPVSPKAAIVVEVAIVVGVAVVVAVAIAIVEVAIVVIVEVAIVAIVIVVIVVVVVVAVVVAIVLAIVVAAGINVLVRFWAGIDVCI